MISMFCALSQNYQYFFFLKMIYASYSKLLKELKNDFEILVGMPSGFLVIYQIVKMLFGSITQEPLGLPKL